MGDQARSLPAIMTEPQVAALLQVSRTTVGRLGRSGAIPRLTIGRAVRYRSVDVAQYLDIDTTERRAA